MVLGLGLQREEGRKVGRKEESEDEDEKGRRKKWVFVLLGLSLRRRFFKLRFFFKKIN